MKLPNISGIFFHSEMTVNFAAMGRLHFVPVSRGYEVGLKRGPVQLFYCQDVRFICCRSCLTCVQHVLADQFQCKTQMTRVCVEVQL